MKKHSGLLLLVLFYVIAAIAQPTKVYIIPTLHGLHQQNTHYNYDSLKAILQRIQPDVLAVEIRPEDIAADTNYLKQNYPYEMWMSRYWLPNAVYAGMDWLGDDIAGKPVPENYWKSQSRIKQLQRNMNRDSTIAENLSRCEGYANERLRILKTSTLKGIYQSNDIILIKAYYDCLNLQLRNTDYEEVTQFYDKRNKKLEENTGNIISQYPGKTIAILTGDDHYPYIKEYLQKKNVIILQP